MSRQSVACICARPGLRSDFRKRSQPTISFSLAISLAISERSINLEEQINTLHFLRRISPSTVVSAQMDRFVNAPPQTHTRTDLNSDANQVNEANAHDSQETDDGSLYKILRKLYEDNWFVGTIHMVLISPLLIFMLLLSALWNLNMSVGLYNPPWYRVCMEIFGEVSLGAMEAIIYLLLVLLENLAQIFPPPLCMKIFITIPLMTIILYATGFLPRESGMMVAIIIHDMAYLVIYFLIDWSMGQHRWADHAKTRVLIEVMFLFWTGRIGFF